MTGVAEDQDLPPDELEVGQVALMAVAELRWLIYALNDAEDFGSHLLRVALEHFEEKAAASSPVKRQLVGRKARQHT